VGFAAARSPALRNAGGGFRVWEYNHQEQNLISRHQWTRRNVLQAAGAVFAAPYLIPSHVLDAAGRPGVNEKVQEKVSSDGLESARHCGEVRVFNVKGNLRQREMYLAPDSL
jgi:hypothetical protein